MAGCIWNIHVSSIDDIWNPFIFAVSSLRLVTSALKGTESKSDEHICETDELVRLFEENYRKQFLQHIGGTIHNFVTPYRFKVHCDSSPPLTKHRIGAKSPNPMTLTRRSCHFLFSDTFGAFS